MTRPTTKFGNRKTVFDGHEFDSQGEATRWAELKYLERAGEIEKLERQVEYVLLPSFKHRGKIVRAIKFVPDFRYVETATRQVVVEDFKGGRATQTEKFRIKVKLFKHQNPDVEFRIST